MNLFESLQSLTRSGLQIRGVHSTTTNVLGHPVHHYRVAGKGRGPPVVLVHGLAGSAHSFARVMVPLANHFSRVWVPDFPGSGFSPLPQQGALTLQEHLDVLKAFIEHEVREPAFVVGNSLGAALAVALAEQVPESMLALALLAPAGARVTQERFNALIGGFKVENPAQALALSRRLFHRAPLALHLLGGMMHQVYSAPAVQAICNQLTLEDSLTPEMLRGLKMPVLLLWGESEKLLPYEGIDYFREHLPPGSQIEIVPGVGHLPQMEKPRLVVDRLAKWGQATFSQK